MQASLIFGIRCCIWLFFTFNYSLFWVKFYVTSGVQYMFKLIKFTLYKQHAFLVCIQAKVHNLAGDDYRSSVLGSIKGWIQVVFGICESFTFFLFIENNWRIMDDLLILLVILVKCNSIIFAGFMLFQVLLTCYYVMVKLLMDYSLHLEEYCTGRSSAVLECIACLSWWFY